MIHKIVSWFSSGLSYVRIHPTLLFCAFLLIGLPILVLYVGNEFLEAGRANQERLQKDRIGIIHDVLAAELQNQSTDITDAEKLIFSVGNANPDIERFRIIERTSDGNEVLVSYAIEELEGSEFNDDDILYDRAFSVPGESIIFEYFEAGAQRHWQALRVVQTDDNRTLFVLTLTSLAAIDTALTQNERNAYWSVFYVFLFSLALSYWLFTITNYRAKYDESQKTIAEKDSFTNVMAHELRAPLTAMRGYASLISESKTVSEENKHHADRIQEATKRLVTIVNDILEVARMQSGKLQLDFAVTDLSELLKTVVAEHTPQATEKNLHLSYPEDTLSEIVTDNKRVHQVLSNLLSNAIKYTNEGSVTVVAKEKMNTVEIRIKDTGVGIHAQDQKKLFTPFYRVQNDSTASITGTGLGMWITSQLVDLLGGTIGIESMKDVGTTVVLQLPKMHLK